MCTVTHTIEHTHTHTNGQANTHTHSHCESRALTLCYVVEKKRLENTHRDKETNKKEAHRKDRRKERRIQTLPVYILHSHVQKSKHHSIAPQQHSRVFDCSVFALLMVCTMLWLSTAKPLYTESILTFQSMCAVLCCDVLLWCAVVFFLSCAIKCIPKVKKEIHKAREWKIHIKKSQNQKRRNETSRQWDKTNTK